MPQREFSFAPAGARSRLGIAYPGLTPGAILCRPLRGSESPTTPRPPSSSGRSVRRAGEKFGLEQVMKQALLPSNRSITVAARIDRPAGGHPEQSEGSAFHPDSLPPRCHPDPALAGKGSAFARLLTRAARIDCPAGGHPERSEGSAFHSDARPPKPWHRRGWLLSFARLLTRAARILTLSRAQRGICFISLLLTFHSPLVTVVSAQGITPQSIITTVAGGFVAISRRRWTGHRCAPGNHSGSRGGLGRQCVCCRS